MNEAPEEGRGTTGEGRASGLSPEEPPCQAGSVPQPSSSDSKVVSLRNASRQDSDGTRSEEWFLTLVIRLGKPAQRSEQEPGGGRGATDGSVLEGGSEGIGRDTRSGSRNSRCGSGAVPSAGWREIAAAMHAEEGFQHE